MGSFPLPSSPWPQSWPEAPFFCLQILSPFARFAQFHILSTTSPRFLPASHGFSLTWFRPVCRRGSVCLAQFRIVSPCFILFRSPADKCLSSTEEDTSAIIHWKWFCSFGKDTTSSAANKSFVKGARLSARDFKSRGRYWIVFRLVPRFTHFRSSPSKSYVSPCVFAKSISHSQCCNHW